MILNQTTLWKKSLFHISTIAGHIRRKIELFLTETLFTTDKPPATTYYSQFSSIPRTNIELYPILAACSLITRNVRTKSRSQLSQTTAGQTVSLFLGFYDRYDLRLRSYLPQLKDKAALWIGSQIKEFMLMSARPIKWI